VKTRRTRRISWRILHRQRKREVDSLPHPSRSSPSFGHLSLPSCTMSAVQMHCVRPDQSGVTNTLHYFSNGSAMLRFSWRKQEYVIPTMLILKALIGAPDREIFEHNYTNTFLTDPAGLLLCSFKMYSLYTRQRVLNTWATGSA